MSRYGETKRNETKRSETQSESYTRDGDDDLADGFRRGDDVTSLVFGETNFFFCCADRKIGLFCQQRKVSSVHGRKASYRRFGGA